jgi:predicted aminopeptidase
MIAAGGVLALGAGAGQACWRTTELRDEVRALREQVALIEGVRAENARLRAAQISPEELERLRADHAALPRLRAEIEALRKRIGGGGR